MIVYNDTSKVIMVDIILIIKTVIKLVKYLISLNNGEITPSGQPNKKPIYYSYFMSEKTKEGKKCRTIL